jgi:hypothetical protein
MGGSKRTYELLGEIAVKARDFLHLNHEASHPDFANSVRFVSRFRARMLIDGCLAVLKGDSSRSRRTRLRWPEAGFWRLVAEAVTSSNRAFP